VLTGMRLVLVYNLVWVGDAANAPRLYRKSPAEVELNAAVKAWEADIKGGGTQKRIALLLGKSFIAVGPCRPVR